jgi:uncharacterized protein DUF1571
MMPMRRLMVLLAGAVAGIAAWYWWGPQPPAQVVPLGKQERVEQRAPLVLTEKGRTRQELLAALACAPGQGLNSIPWSPLFQVGSKGLFPLEILLHYEPILFLEDCLARYEDEVTGYATTFLKQERIQGKLQPLEKVDVHFREEPFSVHMKWLEGARLAAAALYVEGQNNDMIIVRPRLLPFTTVSRVKDGADAKSSGRYTIDQFGIYLGTQRTVQSMRDAQKRGDLHVRYEGLYKVPELNHRACHKLIRSPYHPVEEEGVNELTLYIDQETGLQLGSVLKDVKGELIASYFFTDIQINPEFSREQFQKP